MKRTAFGVDPVLLVGVAALASALAVVAFPGVVPAGVVEDLSGTVRSLVFALGAATGLLGLWTVYRGGRRDEATPVELPATPAERERRREGEVRIVGRSMDDLLERIANPDGGATKVDRLIDQGRVRDAVRETAVAVLVDTGGYTRREAREYVESGAWTDRPRAAAFLGSGTSELPLEVRIRDWLSGEPFERQVRAAVEELADMAGVETGSGMAPEPVDLAAPGTNSTVEVGPGGTPTADAREAETDEFPTGDGVDWTTVPDEIGAEGTSVPPDAGTSDEEREDTAGTARGDEGAEAGANAPEPERSTAREGSR